MGVEFVSVPICSRFLNSYFVSMGLFWIDFIFSLFSFAFFYQLEFHFFYKKWGGG